MNRSDIHMAALISESREGAVCMMADEIPGTKVFLHSLSAGNCACIEPGSEYISILFQCSGKTTMQSGGSETAFSGYGVFIGIPDEKTLINAKEDSKVLQLQFSVSQEELSALRLDDSIPYALPYCRAKKYTEDCKSEKTISRMLVPQRLIPRFAMGSVETSGDDMVAKHTHPMLEQYFFSLAENDCTVMIDDIEVPFGGNTLLHIPLGSDHGIISRGRQQVHYVWMDILLNESGLSYMDSAHKYIK